MNVTTKLSVLIFTAATAACLVAQQSSHSSEAAQPDPHRVVKITLPDEPVAIPPGPHLETYEKNCLVCHSARYVTMQPKFPRATWENEVKKMVSAYGAKISDAEEREIVDYLVAVKGNGK